MACAPYIRAIRETFRDPVPTGMSRRRPRLRAWRHLLHCAGRQALRATVCGSTSERRLVDWHAGTRGDAPASLARGGGDQHGVHRATQRDIPGTPRAAGASGRALARHTLTLQRGDVSWLVPSTTSARRMRVCALSPPGRRRLPRTPAMAAGITDHCWTCARTAVVSRAAISLDAAQAAWTSFSRPCRHLI